MKKTICVIICAIMSISSFFLIKGFSDNSTGNNTFQLGTYPQSRVTDSSTLEALNNKLSDDLWSAYDYYVGEGEAGTEKREDYTFYADVKLSGVRYRAVKFTQYRPESSFRTFYKENANPNEITSSQYKSGYYKNTVYWFEYEPINWTYLDKESGLALCDIVIDTRAVNSKYTADLAFTGTELYGWLNGEFASTAFTTYEKESILSNIRILTISQATNNTYGFSSDNSRIASATEYAKCLGQPRGVISGTERALYWIDDEDTPASASSGNSQFETPIIINPASSNATTYYCSYMGSCDTKYSVQANYGVRPVVTVDTEKINYGKISITYFYDPENNLQHTDYYTPGETVVPYSVSPIEGYDFFGWDGIIPGTAPAKSLRFYAVWCVPKLTPAAGSGLVIERIDSNGNSVAETNDSGVVNGTTPLPFGVELTEKPFCNKYGNYQTGSQTDYDSWFIYGVKEYTTVEELEALIDVKDGYCVVTGNQGQYAGTGTIVTVYDNNNNFVEQFRVIVYGDLDNSGSVTSSDSNIAIQESKKPSWSKSSEERVPYMFRAANVDQSPSFSSSDANMLIMCNKNKAEINQTSGLAYNK